MDLVCGLDNRLPRLLFAPWAKTPDALRNPLSFLSSFEDIKAERILEWLPLFHSLKPAEELDSLIEVLGHGLRPAWNAAGTDTCHRGAFHGRDSVGCRALR